jgi:DNA-binding CsgD family transcriptional regulator
MVNNNSDDLAARLSKLSDQERNVLKLRCQGLDYKTIHERLFISISAVKEYMSRIYVKLGLDLLPRAKRMKVLYETFCPLLQKLEETPRKLEIGSGEGASGKKTPETPEPVIPAYVPDMVDEDEYPLVPVAPAPLVPPWREPKRRRLGLELAPI